MNTGLVDALVLAEALVRVVRDGESDVLLDSYAATRRPAAEKVLSLAGKLTRVATIRSTPGRALRNFILRLLNHVAPFKRRLAMNLSGLSRRDAARLPETAGGLEPAGARRQSAPRRTGIFPISAAG
jgi:2-polyprenyl-6-methoxyphenol hydroxylase-like FAD-dependent oxidoreductase